MTGLRITVTVTGDAQRMQRLSKSLADRRGLHARIAGEAEKFTKDFVKSDDGHKTAQRLGASPTGHMAKISRAIESASDANSAILRIPRASRLRAAFGSYTVKPGPGKKYLTIPDNRRTYGKRAGEITEPMFFKMVGGRHKALCFKDGTVAYWLREQVTIKEDRTLLPLDELPELANRVAAGYLAETAEGGEA